jgi:hypothetical protein
MLIVFIDTVSCRFWKSGKPVRGFLLSTSRNTKIYRTVILPVVFYKGVKLGLSHGGKNIC